MKTAQNTHIARRKLLHADFWAHVWSQSVKFWEFQVVVNSIEGIGCLHIRVQRTSSSSDDLNFSSSGIVCNVKRWTWSPPGVCSVSEFVDSWQRGRFVCIICYSYIYFWAIQTPKFYRAWPPYLKSSLYFKSR